MKKMLQIIITAALILAMLFTPYGSNALAAPTVDTKGLVGFSTVNGKVTGGGTAKTVTASNATDFLKYAKVSEPLVIQVKGTISLPKGMHQIASNKTIIGMGSDAKMTNGGLYLSKIQNVIIQNIAFSNASDDSISIDQGSHHIFIDHNDFSAANDGLLDIIRGSNNITVSWNHFRNHDLTSLVGHSDSQTVDRGKLKVTYHHNWFDGTDQRQPRVRFGEVHVFNNYYGNPNGMYGIGVGVEAKVVSENNYFESKTPTYFLDKSNMKGYVKDAGSHFANGKPKLAAEGIKWNPSSYYSYSLDRAVDVKGIVTSGAGVGKLNQSPSPDPEPQPEPEPQPAPEQPSVQPGQTVYVVAAGDTLWKIARQYGTTVQTIVELNQLNINTPLWVGQILIVPTPKKIYTVQRGDTLWKVAAAHGVTVQSIIEANNLKSSYIRVGQTLVIPVVHTVQAGDTLWNIAQKYGTTTQAIIDKNKLNPVVPLRVGQKIMIP